MSPSDSHQEPRVDEPLARGTEVNRFVLLGLVGRGAMGEVYAAHDPELDRTVAIKLLRSRTTSGDSQDDGRTRLIREAQAIAKVSHPNVVVVYDVGTFNGRVFIAMEFLDGHTLGYWLQSHPRTLPEILEVFGAAGRGLAAAHDKEMVHRDFKPENVMVAGDGQVRVMDFGLAQLAIERGKIDVAGSPPRVPGPLVFPDDTDPLATRIVDSRKSSKPAVTGLSSVSRASNLTQTGSVMGTPAYMSPEQFRGEMTDGRTDQFSFCVALYEAIYGVRPFAGGGYAELAANVIAGAVLPEPPGARVPAAIRRALLRGLSPAVEGRFPSMSALLVELRQESALAATRGFASGAAAKLQGIWEAPSVEFPLETEAKAEIRRAFLATDKPYAALAFEGASRILDRFARRWTELYVDACEATHLRGEQSPEILDLRMAALREALGDLRALCHEFVRARAETVENAVAAANALGTLERCADINLLRAIVRPPDDPRTRAAVEQLQARLSEVRALGRVGRPADALRALTALQKDARETGYSPLLAEVLFVAGWLHGEVGNTDEATRTLEDAAWTAELCRHDEVAAQATANLVYMTGHAQSRFDAGEIWSRHAETVLRRMGGHDQIRGWLFNNRGAMRATQGLLRDAIDDIQLAIAAKEKALGPDDPDVAASIGNAAIYLDELGETAKAAAYTERAVGIMAATFGLEHPRAAVQLANYAEFLNRLDRFAEAEASAEKALVVFERETDPQGLFVTYPLAALGRSYIGLGRFADAVPILERAVRIREAKEHFLPKLAEVHLALGQALWGAGGDRTRARALAEKARTEYQQAPPTPATQRGLAEIDRWLEGCEEPARENVARVG